MHREPNVGFDPGSPGSRPGPKAGAKPLCHTAAPPRDPVFSQFLIWELLTFIWKREHTHAHTWGELKALFPMWLIDISGKLISAVGKGLQFLTVSLHRLLEYPPNMIVGFPWQLILERAKWKLQCLLWPNLRRPTSSFSQYPFRYTDLPSHVGEDCTKAWIPNLRGHYGGLTSK